MSLFRVGKIKSRLTPHSYWGNSSRYIYYIVARINKSNIYYAAVP